MGNRILILNFVGILLLVVLSAFQWQQARVLHAKNHQLEKTLVQKENELAKQIKALKSTEEDLEEFRRQIVASHENLEKETQQNKVFQKTIAALENEKEQLQQSVTKWADAVRGRDERIKEISAKLNESAEARNQAATKFNE